MKTLIYTTAVDQSNRTISDSGLGDLTKPSWEHYCERHGIDFYTIDKELYPNTPPHWFRYWIFDLKPDYDRYVYVDCDIMVHWDAPNIFYELDRNTICAVRDNSGLRWIQDSIEIYKDFFPNIDLDWCRYFNSGMITFDKSHRHLIEGFKQFYIDNQDIINDYRAKHKKSFDQTLFNYFLTWAGHSVNLISERWNLFHLRRREILDLRYFPRMGWFWHFNDIPREHQIKTISSIWDFIKKEYK